MFFAASKLFWTIAEPGNALVLMLALSVALQFSRRTGLIFFGRAGATFVAVVMLMIAATPATTWIAQPLENRFAGPAAPARVDGIILLGGAIDPVLSRDRGQVAVNGAAERILAFVDLGRRYPDARMVFTGGSGSLLRQDVTEDEGMRAALVALGFDAGRVLFENRSRNTWENAVNSRAVVAPKEGETWFLVTSALHMPRAVGVFRAAGWPVTAYPVDFQTMSRGSGDDFFAFDTRLSLLNAAVREWLGLVVYRCTGRSADLFPAP